MLRLQAGGPILVPQGKHLQLRHVYVADVLQAIQKAMPTEAAKGKVYNISQNETISIEDFLARLADMAGCELQLAYLPKAILEESRLYPDCSPFSDSWMSELDNQQSKVEPGMQYTPLRIYLQKLVEYYNIHRPPLPDVYRQRSEEIRLAQKI